MFCSAVVECRCCIDASSILVRFRKKQRLYSYRFVSAVQANRDELILVVLCEYAAAAFPQQLVIVQQKTDIIEHLVELARRRTQNEIARNPHLQRKMTSID